MKKQILVIKDPEMELGFQALCDYSQAVADRLQDNNVLVLPLWPHGEIELIGDKRQMKLTIKTYKDLLQEFEEELDE